VCSSATVFLRVTAALDTHTHILHHFFSCSPFGVFRFSCRLFRFEDALGCAFLLRVSLCTLSSRVNCGAWTKCLKSTKKKKKGSDQKTGFYRKLNIVGKSWVQPFSISLCIKPHTIPSLQLCVCVCMRRSRLTRKGADLSPAEVVAALCCFFPCFPLLLYE
jgi:hypothetical protein